MNTQDITVNIKFFGAFRKFGDGVNLSLPAGSTIAAVKETLQAKLDNNALVLESVLANDNTILRNADIIKADTELSILPPICGG